MASMKRILPASIVLAMAAVSLWLLFRDVAAEPNSLAPYHADITECRQCHVPWRGAGDDKCVECHTFESGSAAVRTKKLRFHEEKKNCMHCHTLHVGSSGSGSKMDHTLLSGKLTCSQCHFDKHDGLFGQECRQCHSIRTWKVSGYRHPPEDDPFCYRCHKAPSSHCEPDSWERLKGEAGVAPSSERDCSTCHTVLDWKRLKRDTVR